VSAELNDIPALTSQVQFATPTPSLTITRPAPKAQPPVLLTLDTAASNIIALSEKLVVARLQSQIAVETAKGDEVEKDQGRTAAGVMTVLNGSELGNYTTPDNEIKIALIDRITLNGLITAGAKTTAYLSIDNVSVRVTQGDIVNDIQVVRVNANEITLKSGKTTRTLKG